MIYLTQALLAGFAIYYLFFVGRLSRREKHPLRFSYILGSVLLFGAAVYPQYSSLGLLVLFLERVFWDEKRERRFKEEMREIKKHRQNGNRHA